MFNSKFGVGVLRHPGYNGKDSPPPPPDYTAAANATAAGNLEAAKYTTQANRVNQVTPYGNLTYSQGSPTVNQSGYDTAMKNYQQQLNAYNQPQNNFMFPWQRQQVSNGPAPVAPNIADYTTNSNQWTATQTLSPQQQALLDKNTNLSSGLLDTAQQGLNYAQNVMAHPGVDQSQLAQVGINPGENYSDAIMRRLGPQMQEQQQAFDAKMANQGVMPGTAAYDAAYRNFTQGQNDQRTSAITGGMNVGLNANQQGFQQAAYNQMQPINVINALRTGSQVQAPNYVNSAQMQNPGGADILGATQAGYNAQLAQSNANNAANSGFMGGLMNLASTGAKLYAGV